MNIDAIVTSTDLIELAERAGAKLRRSNGEMRGACPIHEGHNPSGFSIYNDAGKQRWRCFSGDCGGGDALDFVAAWRGFDLKRAYQYLGGENVPADDATMARLAAERRERGEAYARQKADEYQQALKELQKQRAWETYYTNLTDNPEARELWRGRGIPDPYQDIWQLGYCSSFGVSTDAGRWLTPTLTIPIFDKGAEPINIRHRLLHPPTPNDKYRPERAGLHAAPFIADPENDGILGRALVVEGEIKSMVTYLTLDDIHLQVYGIPGKGAFRDLAHRLENREVYICFDPDAKKQAEEAARMVKGWLIELPVKIDDAIIDGSLDKPALRRLMKSARRMV